MRSPAGVLAVLALGGACSEPAPVVPAAPAPTVPAEEISPELRAQRDAELRDWLEVDRLIGECYEARRASDPSVTGGVAVRFTIMPDGRARDIVIARAEPHDEAAEACIVTAVQAMPFTPSAAPVERTIERNWDDA